MKIKVTVSFYLHSEIDGITDLNTFMRIYEQQLNKNMGKKKLVDFKWETVDETKTNL